MFNTEAGEIVAALLDANEHLRERVALLEKEVTTTAWCENFKQVTAMLSRTATDPGAAKNYVELKISWDQGLLPDLPFRHAAIVMFRDGGKSPGLVASEALKARDEAIELAADLLGRNVAGEPMPDDLRERFEEKLEELLRTPDANGALARELLRK